MKRKKHIRTIGAALITGAVMLALTSGANLSARRGGGDTDDRSDRADKATERAARNGSRAEERAAENQTRFDEERAKIMEDAAKDPEKVAEKLAKLEEEIREEAAEAAEEAAEEAEEYAEELAKAAEDYEYDDDHGSSAEMRDVGASENPEYDRRGFPVRRGEIVALDMGPDALGEAQGRGFALIDQEKLPSLDSMVTRLTVPEGMKSEDALRLMQQIEPKGTFDYTHYYALQFTPSGSAASSGKDVLPRKKDKLTIGMIDTGVMSHPALTGPSIKARDFGAGDGTIPHAHGTAIASILISEGSSSLYVANIFRGGTGVPFTSADAIVRALEWMVSNKVPVVNISLAGPRNAILDKLVAKSVAKGTIIVAAAGNGGPTAPPAYPAALRQVVAVTAVDAKRRVYRYANQGKYITVAARGVGEPAAETGGGIGRFSGTSFATPHISAWMARCLKSSGSAACAATMRKKAIDLGAPGFDPVYGYGLIQ
jgi:subtilisin family serine protease